MGTYHDQRGITSLDDPEPYERDAYRAVLCAHAEDDGRFTHWLEPGETCDRPARPTDQGSL